jgi:hypothetical protein
MNEQQPPPLPLLNTSGQGKAAVVPKEIQKWNWAAFILNWIWGIGNSVPIALVALVANFVPCIGTIAALIISIVLGINGNEWAWRNKRWESVEQFLEVQRKWTRWSVIVLIALVVGAVGITIGYISLNPP